MQLAWKTKYRIKAALAAFSFVATFVLLAVLQVRAGIFFVPLLVLPGMLLALFLWPDVLAPEPLRPSTVRLYRMLYVPMYAMIVAGCFAIYAMSG